MNQIIWKKNIFYSQLKLKICIIFLLFEICNIFKLNNNSIDNKTNIMKMNWKDYQKMTKDRKGINILEIISNIIGKKVTYVKQIFCSQNYPFGNQLIILNNIIYWCETLLKCKRIILDQRYYWYIKNKIILKNIKMDIIVDNISKYYNTSVLIDKSNYFFYSKAEYRINLLKNEIIKNLPAIMTYWNDLYIYIRSGYLGAIYNRNYFQPPLCFYKNIIDNIEYRNIYIIAIDKTNKIIDILLNLYPKIIYKKNAINIDIAYLVNAFNVIGTISTFLSGALQLNDKIRIFWQYGIKTFNYINKQNTLFYIMDFSKEYLNQRFEWKYNKTQIELMIKDQCPNKYKLFYK